MRILLALVGTALAAAVLGPAASPQDVPARFYSASASPVPATATSTVGVTSTFNVTISNCDAACGLDRVSTDALASATITFPAEFSSLQITGVQAPIGGTWSATVSGNTVRVEANEAAFAVLPGQHVVVGVSALPRHAGTHTLTTQAFGGLLGEEPFTLVGEQPRAGVEAGTEVDCSTGSCSGSASDATTSVTVNASGTSPFTLGITLVDPQAMPRPAGACVGMDVLGSGAIVDIVGADEAAEVPTQTVTWVLAKEVVKARASNKSASQFDMCLGSKKVGTNGATFPTKAGTAGFLDPETGFFWGVLPDCKGKAPANPCVVSKHKDNAGNEVIQFVKPSPWDGEFYGG